MRTGCIDLVNCREGDISAQDVVNRYGAVIVAENTVLNKYIICKLYELGIKKLKVRRGLECATDNLRDSGGFYRLIKENYDECILDIKAIVNELAAGKPLNVEKINNISNMVFCNIHDSCDLLNVLCNEKDFDQYTYTHSLNVAFYAMLIGKWLGFEHKDLMILVKAGLLHDIGKTKVPVEILNKKSSLSENEFEIIKKHPLYGMQLVNMTQCFREEVCEAVLLHHERMDKSGYPYGIGGEKLGVHTRIIAIADVYDAMTSDRVYKKRSTPFEVFSMFKTMGVKNFDPKIVNTFLNNLSACYVGSKVMLNTGEVGEIAYIPPQSITEPVININSSYIDMAKEENRHILCMV